jgi:hypothetical protein
MNPLRCRSLHRLLPRWLLGLVVLLLPQAMLPCIAAESPTIITVLGAPGEDAYATNFLNQLERWKSISTDTPTRRIEIGTDSNAGTNDLTSLGDALKREPREGPEPLWLVLVGHGTFDGREARFNLRGPDLSASQLAAWLQPFHRQVVIIDTSAASAPFINLLSATNRVIVTATRSGNELNFARFGQYLAESLSDPASDLDHDGRISLLEVFLAAAARVREFYQTENRLVTEHALIDDNGDQKGTPAEWFRGIRVTQAPKDGGKPDGMLAARIFLKPDPTEQNWPPSVRARRDDLEEAIAHLRETKNALPEAEYWTKLEALLLELADIYETGATTNRSPGTH